ncbi:MAG: helix-turn-helix transcriptional regulator [Oscillospiraceae bacterium]|nr:helix-turn-helix transcriptional regulator [Oscillospiraceae bacterium]
MSKSSSNRFTDVYIQIGIKISYYRKLRGYSQAQLAEKANMSSGFLSQVEAPGMAVAISLEKLLSIAEALQIPPAKLLEFEEI